MIADDPLWADGDISFKSLYQTITMACLIVRLHYGSQSMFADKVAGSPMVYHFGPDGNISTTIRQFG